MKLFIVTKKQLMVALCLIAAVAAVVIGSVGVFANSERLLPIYCVETDKKQVAISFDAAWGNDDTQQLIDILGEYDVPATFFVVGAWVDKYPESVKALSDAGHQIQNHSNTHPHMPQLPKEQMRDEIESCNQKIESVTGVCPTLLRPPYGDYDNNLIEVMDEMNMKTIQWDVETLATKVMM
jgi:peptidoglycan/xylan/chitin deacetylase (PgdA/CDA1 family)